MPAAPPWLPLALLAALGAAGVAVFGKLGVSRADPTLATLARSVVMTAALLGFVLLRAARPGSMRAFLFETPASAWVFLVLAGLCGAGSWLAYFAALARGPAGPVAAVDRLSVAFTFVLAAAFLGERFGPRAWAGLALLVLGLLLIVSDPPRTAPAGAAPPVAAPEPGTPSAR